MTRTYRAASASVSALTRSKSPATNRTSVAGDGVVWPDNTYVTMTIASGPAGNTSQLIRSRTMSDSGDLDGDPVVPAMPIHEATAEAPSYSENTFDLAGYTPPRPPCETVATGLGVQVPGYEIVGELGRGGMGIVYRAVQLAVNRVVALKLLPGGLDARPMELARFEVEAEAVAALQHH